MISLDGKVSEDDISRMSDIRNHSQFEPGFEDGDVGDFNMDDFGMDDLFADSSDFGGGSGNQSNDIFGSGGQQPSPFGGGQQSGGFGGQQSNPFGGGQQSSPFGGGQQSGGFGQPSGGFGQQSGGFGQQPGGFGQQPSPFGQQAGGFGFNGFNNGQQQQQPAKPDTTEVLINAGAEAAKSIGAIIVDLAKSLKDRNVDDFGYLSSNMIKIGGIMIPVSILIGIIGNVAKIDMLSFRGLGLQFTLCGAITVATGTILIGVSAFVLSKMSDAQLNNLNNVPDIPTDDSNATDKYEDNLDAEFDDLFGDLDSLLDDEISDTDVPDTSETFEADLEEVEPEQIDYKKEIEKIQENQYISRETLFNTFIGMFPTCTPKFAEKKTIDYDTKDFKTLETICMKALANLSNLELEDINSSLESANESFFSYELRVKRINKVKKTDELAREIENYMRSGSDDDAVNATVDIEGDFYKIIVTKGVSAIVTFGDIFKLDYCKEFFLDTKNQLPIISGIDELGRVIVEDAKVFDTMLVAGKPRSGKSWYVLSILMCLMLFNSPEDVQFCIIDPKKSNLFKTIALLPHVFGLHDDEYILQILEDIIEVEAPRRKKILSDHRCDDIWALRKKGIRLPILYVVIDEYITVINNLDKDHQKEFDMKIQTLISQLPSQGIRLMFVPHRATGVVNRTNRTMLQFTAAVRADTADVIDTLGIKNWSRPLTNQGDIAVKSSSLKNALYVRGAALTVDDGENSILIENAAKAFYKMGVDIPDMSNLRMACNRNDAEIQKELGSNGTRVQYDSTIKLLDTENMDLDDVDNLSLADAYNH